MNKNTKIKIICGIRKSGKTKYIYTLMKEEISNNNRFLYISLSSEYNAHEFLKYISEIVNKNIADTVFIDDVYDIQLIRTLKQKYNTEVYLVEADINEIKQYFSLSSYEIEPEMFVFIDSVRKICDKIITHLIFKNLFITTFSKSA